MERVHRGLPLATLDLFNQNHIKLPLFNDMTIHNNVFSLTFVNNNCTPYHTVLLFSLRM